MSLASQNVFIGVKEPIIVTALWKKCIVSGLVAPLEGMAFEMNLFRQGNYLGG